MFTAPRQQARPDAWKDASASSSGNADVLLFQSMPASQGREAAKGENHLWGGCGTGQLPQLRKSVLLRIFSGAYLLRWNDKLRPRDLLEVDKQGHKMIVAFILWERASRRLSLVDSVRLARLVVEGGIAEYLYRLVITDIKPSLIERIRQRPEQVRRLTEHVMGVFEPELRPLGAFWERFRRWHGVGDAGGVGKKGSDSGPEGTARSGAFDGVATDASSGRTSICETTGPDAEMDFLARAPRGWDAAEGEGCDASGGSADEPLGDAALERMARHILEAAHTYASRWEFDLIRPMNEPFDREIPSIARRLEERLGHLVGEVDGLDDLIDSPRDNALAAFASFVGQLRFQVRWTQVPRMPQTDVLGHMFMVASMAYFMSLSQGAGPARACTAFFTGLFHDLPELLTRDIITPVKKSSRQLEELIHECEEEELRRRIFEPLERQGEGRLAAWLRFLLGLDLPEGEGGLGPEFREAALVFEGGAGRSVSCEGSPAEGPSAVVAGKRPGREHAAIPSFSQAPERWRLEAVENVERLARYEEVPGESFDEGKGWVVALPKDGILVKACDTLAAFLEADASISVGVSSPHLRTARVQLRDALVDGRRFPDSLGLRTILADFD